MRIARVILVAALAAACSSSPAAPAKITLKGGESGLVSLPAGRYRFDWTSTCTSFFVEYAPTSGATPIHVMTDSPPSGSATVDLPAGPAYVNRGGICPNGGDYSVSVQPAG